MAYNSPVLSESTLGALLALGAALTWAVTSLLVRPMLARQSAVAINAARTTAGGGLLALWVLLAGDGAEFAALSGPGLVLLVGSIVVAIGIGDTVFFESTRTIGLARAMTISMTYPVGAALLAAATVGEPITPGIAAGTLLTLGGLVLIVGARGTDEPARRLDGRGLA
ncbi:MAG TPA: EamA family transporter, partial [Candidatus Tectomicrobia bacterium]|nr:EamA family transporter [Candidatus Tectomicrobia bacterium]